MIVVLRTLDCDGNEWLRGAAFRHLGDLLNFTRPTNAGVRVGTGFQTPKRDFNALATMDV